MKQIVIFPRGQLTDADRRAMSKAGVLALEADDPSKVVAVIPCAPLISGDEMLIAAMTAIGSEAGATSVRIGFANELARVAKSKGVRG